MQSKKKKKKKKCATVQIFESDSNKSKFDSVEN
jgi:hypothetical protein